MEENVYTIEYILENGLDKSAYGFIYITTNMINGMKYIGQRKFYQGWKNYLGSGRIFLKAVSKYGKNNFRRKIINIAYNKQDLNKLEISIIKKYNAIEDNNYYNIVQGGGVNSGFKFSKEHIAKIASSNLGRKNSDEAKQRMSKAHLGKKLKPFTEEHKNKIRLSQLGKKLSNEHKRKLSDSHRGKIVSEETKRILSERQRGYRNCNYGKPMSQKTKLKLSNAKRAVPDDLVFEIRKKYVSGNYSQKELGNEYNISGATISYIVNYKGAYKHTYRGEEVINHREKIKIKVVCLNEVKIFDSIKEASEFYSCNQSSIISYCKGKIKSAGKHPITNEPLRWMYYDEYIKLQLNT